MAPKTMLEQVGVAEDAPTAVEPPVVVEEPVDDRPSWLPENFEKPEDLAASYREAQNRIREQGESQKAMEQQLANLATLVEQQNQQHQQPQQGNQQVNEQLMAAYETDPIGTIVFLANQVADGKTAAAVEQMTRQFHQQAEPQHELVANTAQTVMMSKFDDWGKYGPRVAEVIERDPSLLPESALRSLEGTTSALERIYKTVKYDDLTAQIESGTFNSDASRMKRQAQTVSGGGAGASEPSELDDKMARLTAAAKGNSYAAFRGGA